MKRPILILILLGIFAIILIPIFLALKKPGASPSPNGQNANQQLNPSPTEQPIPSPNPTIQVVFPTAPIINPNDSSITISGVQMNNFTKTSTQMNQEGDLSIANVSNSYQIVYLAHFQEFLITINGSPFEAQRQAAEAAFLQSLGISQTDACKLPVSITTPRYANPDQAGTQYPLSFCQ